MAPSIPRPPLQVYPLSPPSQKTHRPDFRVRLPRSEAHLLISLYKERYVYPILGSGQMGLERGTQRPLGSTPPRPPNACAGHHAHGGSTEPNARMGQREPGAWQPTSLQTLHCSPFRRACDRGGTDLALVRARPLRSAPGLPYRGTPGSHIGTLCGLNARLRGWRIVSLLGAPLCHLAAQRLVVPSDHLCHHPVTHCVTLGVS